MALLGFVRVSTQKQETVRQHDALHPICVRVFEEKVSGRLDVSVGTVHKVLAEETESQTA